jgi:lanosterol synthase
MQGTNGSQLWDTSLAMHAVVNGDLYQFPEFRQSIEHALEFIDDCQIKQNVPDRQQCFRQVSKGAWPFSTRDCGWIVSDCTAEGLKAVLTLQNAVPFTKQLVAPNRIYDAVDVLLGMQNVDGGFASYERRRGPLWLEMTNPSEVFGEIMVDYSYVECSSAVIQALTCFQKWFPDHRASEIRGCIQRAIKFISGEQRADGGFFGSWGICFTYAGWFAMEAYACVNQTYENSENVCRGCDFLVSKQKPDGGWGEYYSVRLKFSFSKPIYQFAGMH